MRKHTKLKVNREFLKKRFPENISPSRKLSKKKKRFLQEKIIWFKRTRRKIKRLERYLQRKANHNKKFIKKFSYRINSLTGPNRHNSIAWDNQFQSRKHNKKRYSFLFSSDQIRNDILQTERRTRPGSEFLLKLKEKKKFSLLYGNISRKFFQKAFFQATKKRGKISENLLIQFEKRLDIILYRICFAKTIATARQYINHNFVYVNGVKTNICSYQVKPGDVISISSRKKQRLANLLITDTKKNRNTRHFRYLISIKYLKREIGRKLSSLIFIDSLKNRNSQTSFDPNRLYAANRSVTGDGKQWNNAGTLKTGLFSPSLVMVRSERGNLFVNEKTRNFNLLTRNIKKLVDRVNKLLHTRKRQKKKKRIRIKETISRSKNLNHTIYETGIEFKRWASSLSKKEFSLFLQKKGTIFIDLMMKKLMYRKPSRYGILSALKISPQKPLHVEVSYKVMSAVILFPPQKIAYPATLNLDLLCRSLSN